MHIAEDHSSVSLGQQIHIMQKSLYDSCNAHDYHLTVVTIVIHIHVTMCQFQRLSCFRVISSTRVQSVLEYISGFLSWA